MTQQPLSFKYEEEEKRIEGKAFIPKSNEYLGKFADINSESVKFANKKNPVKIATLDMEYRSI